MPELLLELMSEEIPARMQARAAEDLMRLVTEGLTKAGLEYDTAEAYVTPRRLTLVVDGIPAMQADLTEERKGPRVGSPERAIEGFLKSAGLASLDDCEKRDVKGNEFWFVVSTRKGGASTDAINGAISSAINGLAWPKSMRWANSPFRWVRPLHNVAAVFGGETLPGSVNLGGQDTEMLAFQNRTAGHRFLAPKSFAVKSFADYRAKLKDAHVLLDPAERRAKIEKDAAARAKKAGLTLRDDPSLLDEVTGLVEWPVVLMGAIDEAFMDVPQEVLITSMRAHQKYFALTDASGKLAPKFILVANIETNDKGKAIVAGNERVLRARLSDAKFFWDQDRKASLSSRIPALNAIIYHERLGSIGDKVDRVGALAAELSVITGADRDKVRSAARLAKADLTTDMVGEFPELQGVMGRYYALHDGESPEVAGAVAEHYAPQGPNDGCPTAPVSVTVALADKLDTLVGFWTIGETPTGSRDPYGLRRAALGVIRLILENKLRLPLVPILNAATQMILDQHLRESVMETRAALDDLGLDEHVAVETLEVEVEEDERYGEIYAVVPQLLAFFADRLKVHLRGQGVRHDQIDAVFAVGGEDDIVRLLARVDALATFLESEDGQSLLAAYKRASNIVEKESKKDSAKYEALSVDEWLHEPAEQQLYRQVSEVDQKVNSALREEDYGVAMRSMATLRGPVDEFFEQVTVNVEDQNLRKNRLGLLAWICLTMNRVADFSRIEGR
ncbi:MAG TPA: glycine--tRNA ligase subunit beta [Alphaproteobacteria bacterium]|nr:glycine--tRNA ligase subunit beta [Alphaproteobacteria bacterium]